MLTINQLIASVAPPIVTHCALIILFNLNYSPFGFRYPMSTNSSSSDESEGWQELMEEDSDQPHLVCLLCTHSSHSTVDFFSHLNEHEDWNNFLNHPSCQIYDQYDWIRFVNFIRSQVRPLPISPDNLHCLAILFCVFN